MASLVIISKVEDTTDNDTMTYMPVHSATDALRDYIFCFQGCDMSRIERDELLLCGIVGVTCDIARILGDLDFEGYKSE